MIIDTNSWKPFYIKQLFDVKAGKGESKNTGVGIIPYVSATALNNGVSKFVSCSDPLLEKPNTISISRNGSVGECFYHSYTYIASLDDIRVLTPINFELDQYIAHFIMTIIRLEQPRYNYGRKFGTERIKNTIIKIPINTRGNPDWDYMREFIKNTIDSGFYKIKQALENKAELEKPLLPQETPILDTTNWKSFRYDEVFDITKGFYNKKPEETIEFDYDLVPFIGATEYNNGITSYHTVDQIESASKDGAITNQSLDDKIFSTNCITVSNNGSVGRAFYQEKKFTCSHDVNPLYLKNKELNRYIAMFLCAVIELEQYRWNYGRKWRPVRMPNSIIKLPVDPQDNPDWDYMENYIKTLNYSTSI